MACRNDPVASTPVSPTPPPTSPPVSLIVGGTVLDFQTAKPIAGAVVGFGTATGVAGVPIGMTETSVTDANGRYVLPEPPARANNARYIFFVDNQQVGSGFPRAANYRADLAVDRGLCISRYGMVLDSKTYLPIIGATALDLSNQVVATTDQSGWYQIDWGCGVGSLGFNTRWNIMTHPDYVSSNFASGRGISGVDREDVMLTPK